MEKATPKLPGPLARKTIERDAKVMSLSYTRPYSLVIDKGEGMYVYDPDGNRFLDFTAGIAVCATGHSHPEVVQAIKDQAQRFLHMSGTDFYYQVQIDLAEQLASLVTLKGKGRRRVFFTNSGAESIEAAIKCSRHKQRRTQLLAYYSAFHGRTMGAMSLSCSKIEQRRGFAPMLPGVTHIFYPYCYRCPFNLKHETCDLYCLRYVEEIVFAKEVDPGDVAAIFFEPIQGEGGYIVPPADYFPALRELCDRYEILLIADEIQSGMGRTGKFLASEHFGLQPDIVCLAKGIASGLPLGAIVANEEVMNWGWGSHASTFGGNPVCCAAGVKTVELLQRELMKNAEQVGNYILKQVKPWIDRYEIVGDVRGVGLMIGIEIIKDKKSKAPASELRNTLLEKCFERGVLLLGCGDNTVRIAPALLVTQSEADQMLETLEKVIKETAG